MVVREMALDISAAAYSPDMVEHIPGVSNAAADILSGLAGPNPKPLPAYLHHVKRVQVAPRCLSWWRSEPTPS